jgi:hypothetical protein
MLPVAAAKVRPWTPAKCSRWVCSPLTRRLVRSSRCRTWRRGGSVLRSQGSGTLRPVPPATPGRPRRTAYAHRRVRRFAVSGGGAAVPTRQAHQSRPPAVVRALAQRTRRRVLPQPGLRGRRCSAGGPFPRSASNRAGHGRRVGRAAPLPPRRSGLHRRERLSGRSRHPPPGAPDRTPRSGGEPGPAVVRPGKRRSAGDRPRVRELVRRPSSVSETTGTPESPHRPVLRDVTESGVQPVLSADGGESRRS